MGQSLTRSLTVPVLVRWRSPLSRGAALPSRLAVLVLAGVVPLLIFNLATIYADFRNDRERALRQTLDLSRALAQTVSGFLNARIAVLLVLAESPDLRGDDLTAFRVEAERAITTQPEGSSFLVWRRDGRQLLNTGLPPDAALPAHKEAASAGRAFVTGRPVVSGVFVPAGGSEQMVAIDVPVRAADGQVSRVLALHLRLAAFAPLIRQHKPEDGWIIAVIDQNGIRVAREPGEQLVGEPARPSMFQGGKRTSEATFEVVSPEGVPVFAGYSRLPDFDWVVSSASPTWRLTDPAWASAGWSIAAGLSLLALGFILVRRVSRGITGPLAALRHIAIAPDDEPPGPTTVDTGLPETDEVAWALILEKRLRGEAMAGLERALDERTSALGQRDLLLREVYHRVKNNLQLIDGFLSMRMSRTKNRELEDALLDLRGRVHALGLVHQQLMTSPDLRTFDIAPFLRQLTENIVAAGGGRHVGLSVDASPMMVTLDFATPLGLLVNELVTNCLKHAASHGETEIAVTLRGEPGGAVVLTVSASKAAADPEPRLAIGPAGPAYRSGLGMEIIEGLVAQIDGTMKVRDQDGYTTEIRIESGSYLNE